MGTFLTDVASYFKILLCKISQPRLSEYRGLALGQCIHSLYLTAGADNVIAFGFGYFFNFHCVWYFLFCIVLFNVFFSRIYQRLRLNGKCQVLFA